MASDRLLATTQAKKFDQFLGGKISGQALNVLSALICL
jgi:hypothetical protein